MVLGGGTPYMDVRFEGVWNDWMLRLLRRGVPSIGERGFSNVAGCERRLAMDPSKPPLEPGLDRPPDPSD